MAVVYEIVHIPSETLLEPVTGIGKHIYAFASDVGNACATNVPETNMNATG
jgi:hypothetical protein